jgi:hypothetical protein
MGRPPIGNVPMTERERQRRCRLLAQADAAGRQVRIDRINDETRTALSGDTPVQRAQKLQLKAASWGRWLRTMTKAAGAQFDAAQMQVLAQALARMEERSEDNALAAIREILRKLENW